MSMDVGGSSSGPKGDINITPLIDVVLVLLIIFMVLTPTMLKELTANVPKKQEDNTPPPPDPNPPMVLEITAKSELLLNTEPLSPETLADKVTERLKHDRLKVVFFKVDDEAMYGDVVKFMDIVKGAGAKTLAIITKN
jgi:biopolymer transport protein ExbD